MSTALIDGDIIAYRAAAFSQADIDWKDGATGLTVDAQGAIDKALRDVEEWTKLSGSRNQCLVMFSSKHNFRKYLCPTYKANRVLPKPEAYRATVAAVEDRFDCVALDGIEADDLLGIYSTGGYVKDPVVVSIDKDMKTLPVVLFNPMKDRKPHKVSITDANDAWMRQTLMGDATDGYPGLYKVGMVRAAKIVAAARAEAPRNPNGLDTAGFGAVWKAVGQAYKQRKRSWDDALLNARLARILRAEDLDGTSIRLWHPTIREWLSLSAVTEEHE